MVMDRANPTTFKLSLPKVPTAESIDESNPFLLQLFETVIPSVTITPHEMQYQGRRSFGSALDIEYGEWSTLFFIDEDFSNYSLIYDWMMSITDGISHYHSDNILENQIDGDLLVMDNFMNVVSKFRFSNLFPTTLGEVTLSYQEGESFLTCSVTFLYDYFKKI